MPTFTDQTGRTISLNNLPKRIISLVPSQTELLYQLGLAENVIGITKFCVHPEEWFRTKTRVGGTKTIDIPKIHSLQPDLIIANKEENVADQVLELAENFPVWTSDIHDLSTALQMIQSLGELTGKPGQALEIINSINIRFSKLQPLSPPILSAYLIWNDPYMTIGGDTFIHDMMKYCGFTNLFGNATRYPITTVDELKENNCELILLSSEPFPFSEKHVAILQEALPQVKIILVDGEYFSWYGSRLAVAPFYFNTLIKAVGSRE